MFSHDSRSEATIEQSYEHLWFITIKPHQVLQYTTPDELMHILGLVKAKLPSIEIIKYRMEVCPTRHTQLHLHAIVGSHKPFRFSAATSIEGYRVYWKKATYLRGLENYISKKAYHEASQQQQFDFNYYRHNYAFDDPVQAT